MKTLYDCITENTGFVYYQDENGEYRFADNNSDAALTGAIENPEDIVYDENSGWVFSDGSDLPWA